MQFKGQGYHVNIWDFINGEYIVLISYKNISSLITYNYN